MKVRRVLVKIAQSGSSGRESTYEFSYPETRIDFMVSQTDSEEPDNCFVTIYGVSKETYALFNSAKNKGYADEQQVEVYHGYDDDMSLVFSGNIDRATYKFSHGSQTLTLLINKNAFKYNNEKKSISINEPQTIKNCVKTIANAHGYYATFGNDNRLDSVTIGRFCHTGTVGDALRCALPEGYGYYIDNESIHVYGADKSVSKEITIWSENGLLEYPTEDSKQEKTTIKTILMPAVESGMIINIPIDDIWFSPTDTGKYKSYVVGNYVTSFQGGIGTTEFECEGGLDI